jgi:hypothetical protein
MHRFTIQSGSKFLGVISDSPEWTIHPYSPDLAPCDFFLFGAMKEDVAWQHFDGIDELFQSVEGFLAGFLTMLSRRFFSNG